MNAYVRIVSTLSKLGGLFAMALLAAAVVIVCQMIFMRYVLKASTIWQTEFVIYSLMAATFIGSAHVLMRKGHVGVDVLPSVLPPRARFWLELVAGLLSLTFCSVLAWSGWTFFEEAWSSGWTTDTVWHLPLWIPLLPLPLGIGLLCLQYVAEMIKLRQELTS